MANLKIPTVVRNNMMDEISTYAGASAILKILSGSQPAGGGAETTVLAQLTCDVAAFAPAASGGVLTLNGITADTAADASGTATWFRIYQSDGTTWVLDGDVTTQSAGTGDLQLDDTAIVLNGTVSLTGPNTLTAPNAA
jgi:hypothetical protein